MILSSTSAVAVRRAGEIATHATGMPGARSIRRFGPFEVSLDRRELRKHGMRLKLEDKPFEILEALLAEPGRLVTRDELRARLWPDTFVSYDHCLNTAVNKLRSALGDTSKFFRFVETVRRRGYRFIGALDGPQPPDPRPARSVLLVLPFRTQPSDRASRSFSDGLTEELSAQIARAHPTALGTIAVSTAMLYKDAPWHIDEIARKVGADLVLEGSVRYAAHRVRISVQLVEASDQVCLWSEIYERVLADSFACQAEIAQLIASTLGLKLGLRSSERHVEEFGGPISVSSERIRKLGS